MALDAAGARRVHALAQSRKAANDRGLVRAFHRAVTQPEIEEVPDEDEPAAGGLKMVEPAQKRTEQLVVLIEMDVPDERQIAGHYTSFKCCKVPVLSPNCSTGTSSLVSSAMNRFASGVPSA